MIRTSHEIGPGRDEDGVVNVVVTGTGTLRTVTADLSGDLSSDSESEMRLAMARQ